MLKRKKGKSIAERYRKLLKVSKLIATELCLDKSRVETIIQDVADLLNVERVSIFIYEESERILWTPIITGREGIELVQGEGIASWVFKTGEKVLTYAPYKHPQFSPLFDKETGFKTKNIFALPLKGRRGKILGVLELINNKDGKYGKIEIEFVEHISHELSIALDNIFLLRKQKRLFESFISAMAKTIDARYPATVGHSKRVAEYATGIARELELPPDRIELVRVASLLHDYGKIITPDYILCKNGPLTPEEFEIVKEHPLVTFQILNQIDFPDELKEIPKIAARHHERYDGSGYPYGEKGEELPIEAQVLAIADVFDALTSERTYKEAGTFQTAKNMIIAGQGTQFAPEVVEAFLKFYEKRFGASED